MRRNIHHILEEGMYNPELIPRMAWDYFLKQVKCNITLRCYVGIYSILLCTVLLRLCFVTDTAVESHSVTHSPLQEYESVQN